MKNFAFEKVVKKFQKIVEHRLRRTDYKYLARVWCQGNILEIFRSEIRFLKHSKKLQYFNERSWKIVEVIQEMRRKVASGGPNL